MKNNFIKNIVVCSTLLLPQFSYAVGTIMDAKVTGLYCGRFGGKNVCSVYFDKLTTSSPSCATNYRYRMQINADTDIGKSMLSLALTANSTQKIVVATGTGDCFISGDTEDMNSIFISPPCSEINTWGCTHK